MTRTVKQAEWDLYKQQQRSERAGLRGTPPKQPHALSVQQARENSKRARRRIHQRRRSQRVSVEHHLARIESKRIAHR